MPGTGMLGRGELASLELLLPGTEREVEHRLDVPGRDVVAEQILDVTEQVLGLLSGGELPPDARGRERRHLRARTRDFYPCRHG